jgi:hypothetical protein
VSVYRGTVDGMVGAVFVTLDVAVVACDHAGCGAYVPAVTLDEGTAVDAAVAEGWATDGTRDYCPAHPTDAQAADDSDGEP